MALNKTDLDITAQAIWRQLGGGKFAAMTGARALVAHDVKWGGISFKLPRFSGVKVNYVKIILNDLDLYEVEFGRIYNNTYKEISKHTGIYNDQLRELFERVTGLRTSL